MCIVTVGGREPLPLLFSLGADILTVTNNPYAEDGYQDVEILIEPQTVKEWMIDRVLDVDLGKKRGDRSCLPSLSPGF